MLFAIKTILRISLRCKLIPVQYQEYECGLFRVRKIKQYPSMHWSGILGYPRRPGLHESSQRQ